MNLGGSRGNSFAARSSDRRLLAALFALMLAMWPAGGRAGTIAGPIAAEVVEVIDGDTLRVRATIWPGLEAVTAIRVKGMDAPELKGACAAERAAAQKAKARLAGLAGRAVTLKEIEADKFGGRMLARVFAPDGTEIAAAMIAEGLARPYAGGRRPAWPACP